MSEHGNYYQNYNAAKCNILFYFLQCKGKVMTD